MLKIANEGTPIATFDGEYKFASGVSSDEKEVFKIIADSIVVKPQDGDKETQVADVFERAGYDVEIIPEAEVEDGGEINY